MYHSHAHPAINATFQLTQVLARFLGYRLCNCAPMRQRFRTGRFTGRIELKYGEMASAPQSHAPVPAAGCQKRRRRVKRHRGNTSAVALQSRHTSRRRVVRGHQPQSHGLVVAAGCQKRRRRVKRHRGNIAAMPLQSRHTSRRRVAEEVAARESARAQPECVTDRAFAVEAKQPLSKHGAQSPSGNQQKLALRANMTSHRFQCIGFKGAPVATRENGLQLLHGGLKRVQERGAR